MNAARGYGHEDLDVRKGIEALRRWFFLSVERTSDPDDVISPFPPFPEVELLNEMDTPPAEFDEPPPGAMSIFDFYASFTKDADLWQKDDCGDLNTRAVKRAAPAAYARERSSPCRTPANTAAAPANSRRKLASGQTSQREGLAFGLP